MKSKKKHHYHECPTHARRGTLPFLEHFQSETGQFQRRHWVLTDKEEHGFTKNKQDTLGDGFYSFKAFCHLFRFFFLIIIFFI